VRIHLVVAVCAIASAAPVMGAQAPAGPTGSPPDIPVALSQCEPIADRAPGRFSTETVLARRTRNRTVKATPLIYTSSGMRVVGRLVPTVNIAAQLGSLDPTIQTMAFMLGEQNYSGLEPRGASAVSPQVNRRTALGSDAWRIRCTASSSRSDTPPPGQSSR
jgi:hypothetical protein